MRASGGDAEVGDDEQKRKQLRRGAAARDGERDVDEDLGGVVGGGGTLKRATDRKR